jgi:DNA-binding response OmpR family regulator
MKIFLIEDEEVFALAITYYLKRQGYLCETASDYSEALEKIHMYEYDCVILDLKLPGGNGIDLLKFLRDRMPAASVIISSSNHDLDSKINGLNGGADDYIVKPYEFDELLARIKAVIRRRVFTGLNSITYNEIKLIPDARQVFVRDKEVNLTAKEFNILIFLISHKDKVVTKEAIAENIWGDNADQADSYHQIYTHLKNLRKKLTEAGAHDYVQTLYGMGYKFSA